MVLCTECRHYARGTTCDYCEAINEIVDIELVYDDLPCDFYDRMDGNDSA